MSRKPGNKIKLYAFIIGINLLLLELLSFFAVKYFEDKGGILDAHPILHHTWKPYIRFHDQNRSEPYYLVTNGNRWVEEYDIPTQKEARTFRIFFVGDSNVQGVVAPENKMVEVVEKKLNQSVAPDVKIEVINTGTSSYSPALYYLLVKNELIKYSPDLIVICVDMTDVANDYNYLNSHAIFQNGDLISIDGIKEKKNPRTYLYPEGFCRLSNYGSLYNFLAEHTSTFRLINTALLKTKVKKCAEFDKSANWLSLEWDKKVDSCVNNSLGFLSKTVRFLKDKNIKVMLTGVPHYPQYAGEWSNKPHTVLEEFAAKEHIPFLNSYERLKPIIENTKVEKYYWNTDPTHFNKAGNEIWAASQVEFLTNPSNGLIPFSFK